MELLRLGAFFSNAALVAQLCAWLGGQMAGLPEETLLEVRWWRCMSQEPLMLQGLAVRISRRQLDWQSLLQCHAHPPRLASSCKPLPAGVPGRCRFEAA